MHYEHCYYFVPVGSNFALISSFSFIIFALSLFFFLCRFRKNITGLGIHTSKYPFVRAPCPLSYCMDTDHSVMLIAGYFLNAWYPLTVSTLALLPL